MDTRDLWGQAKRLFVWLVAILLVGTTGIIVYFQMPFHGTSDTLSAVEENGEVTVTQRGDTYVLEPTQTEPEAGLVFYPGGRVHPDAYVASLAPVASEANVTVIIPEMRLNLAILSQNVASEYISDSSVERWYVGGHSLGGAMACRYGVTNRGRVEGIILFASYCDRDLSETELDVLSVTGSADTVLNRNRYERGLMRLPSNATVEELQLNHSQFGSYRGQPGDAPSRVSYQEAHDSLANVTIRWIRSRRPGDSYRADAVSEPSFRQTKESTAL